MELDLPVAGLIVSSRGRAGNTFKWQCLKTLNQSCKRERSMTSFAAMSSLPAQGQISIAKHGFPWNTMMQGTASENTAGILRICRESREKISVISQKYNNLSVKQGWLLRRKLNGTRTWQSPNWNPSIATVDSCFLQAVWTMHSVGAKWTVAIVFPTEDSIHLWPQGKTNEHF